MKVLGIEVLDMGRAGMSTRMAAFMMVGGGMERNTELAGKRTRMAMSTKETGFMTAEMEAKIGSNPGTLQPMVTLQKPFGSMTHSMKFSSKSCLKKRRKDRKKMRSRDAKSKKN